MIMCGDAGDVGGGVFGAGRGCPPPELHQAMGREGGMG